MKKGKQEIELYDFIKGAYLSLIGILAIIFNKMPYTLTILYLFPISLMFFSFKDLIYCTKNKDLENKIWFAILIRGIIFLCFSLFFVINFNTKIEAIIRLSSLFIIFYTLINIFINNQSKKYYIDFIILLLISIIFIFSYKTIANHLIYFYILFILMGIKNIILKRLYTI